LEKRREEKRREEKRREEKRREEKRREERFHHAQRPCVMVQRSLCAGRPVHPARACGMESSA